MCAKGASNNRKQKKTGILEHRDHRAYRGYLLVESCVEDLGFYNMRTDKLLKIEQ